MGELYNAISQLQTAHPDAFFIVAGDFNKASLKSVLPQFHQHVKYATRGNNTLDLLYTNIKNALIAAPLACLQAQSETRATSSQRHQSIARGGYSILAVLL